jgi:DNA-binding NtrC family response regulator
MAGLHALIEVLDAADEVDAVEAAVRAWAANQTPPCETGFVRGPGAASIVAEREIGDGGTEIVVPAPADEPTAIRFTTAMPRERLGDAFRRMLVVAGRIVGSSLTLSRRLAIMSEEAAALRTLSFGAARRFLGDSAAAQKLGALVPRLAASAVGILIEGETGVGKTFVARLIHESGPRAHDPLRVINCAAIPDNLLESEIFGHERGAFTGAVATRVGALESAERGTLFLDEVGELSLASQAKLLHVLETKRFERLGSNRSIELRARVICATNRDLEQMVKDGTFRQDLLFRIAVVRVRVPSLRDRGDDLVLLANQLLADATRSAGRRVTGFSPAAIERLRNYPWPGNVRELRNAIEHAIALGEGVLVEPEDLPPGLIGPAAQPDDPDSIRLPADLASLERRAIESALRSTGGNRIRAAAILGINRATLYNKLKEYGAYYSRLSHDE